MFLRGRIALGNISALVVPEPAVVYLSAKPTIFVVDAEMKAHARRVDTGARQDGMIAISGQIAEGERVVMMGAGYLKEGDKIVIADKLPDAKIKPMPQSF
jgi:HlyD family secretion protein